MVLDISLLNTQHYKLRIKGKGVNPRKGVAPFLTPWCCSYWKGSLWVTLDYVRRLDIVKQRDETELSYFSLSHVICKYVNGFPFPSIQFVDIFGSAL